MKQKIGEYQILGTLREGPRPLYRARDWRGQVALKTFPLEKLSEEMRERLRREAADSAALDHPHLVKVHASGQDAGDGEGILYIAMDLLEGFALDEFFAQRRPLSWEQKLSWMDQMCSGLEYLHARGLVHGGIRPARIFVENSGRISVLGLGPARAELSKSAHPRYLTPEQILGESYTAASDVFALGAVLFELATGQYPFETPDNDPGKLAKSIVFRRPQTIKALAPDVPPGLDMAIYRALQKDVALRLADAGALRRELAASKPSTAAGPGEKPKLATLTKQQQEETLVEPPPSARRPAPKPPPPPLPSPGGGAAFDPHKTLVIKRPKPEAAGGATGVTGKITRTARIPTAALPPRDSVFCPSCTHANPKGSVTCAKCGLPLAEEPMPASEPAGSKPWYRNEAVITASVLALLLLLLVVWAWLYKT